MAGYEAIAVTEIAASPDRVWAAMTDPDQVAQYMMGSRVESDWHVGSAITWSGEREGKAYQDKGKVLEVVPGRVLAFTHHSPLTGQEDGPDKYHTVRYWLEESGDDTTVTLTQGGCDSEEQAEQFAQNWQEMLNGLKTVAESH